MEQTLGKRIVLHRKRLDLTQDQLAEKLGVTAQAVSKWENDLSCPDISTLPKLASIFGISIDALLGSEPETPVFQGEIVQEERGEPKKDKRFHWDLELEGGKNGALGFALLVLTVGVQLLIAGLLEHELTFWHALWPAALFIFGMTGLFRKFSFFRAGSLLFGAYFMLEHWNILPFSLSSGLVFPVILVILGLSLMVDAFKKPKRGKIHTHRDHDDSDNQYQVDGDTFEYSASFGDSRQNINMERLSLGKISTSFGDYSVDLSGVKALTSDCTLEVHNSFGDLELLVPGRYTVVPTSNTSFADVHISGQPDSESQGTIRLQAHASFGDIAIRYI